MWALVIVTPEETKIKELRRGTWKGLIAWIPLGGQIPPNSIAGLKEKWKNDQKNEKKNINSEIINKIIPNLIDFWTFNVCCPWKVLSRTMSRAHKKKIRKKFINEIINLIFPNPFFIE